MYRQIRQQPAATAGATGAVATSVAASFNDSSPNCIACVVYRDIKEPEPIASRRRWLVDDGIIQHCRRLRRRMNRTSGILTAILEVDGFSHWLVIYGAETISWLFTSQRGGAWKCNNSRRISIGKHNFFHVTSRSRKTSVVVKTIFSRCDYVER